MIQRAFPLTVSLILLSFWPSQARAEEGLSTTFVKVVMSNVPLGKKQPLISKTGPGVTVINLGDEKISVVVEILQPMLAQLRPQAEPIPDVSWIQIAPKSFELEGHESYTLDAELTVPDKRMYRRKNYQAMIWIHGAPADENGLTLGAGLLARFQFKTAVR